MRSRWVRSWACWRARRRARQPLSAGSPGGALIIHFITKTLLATLQGSLSPQAAIDLPNFGTLGGPVLLEDKRFPAATVQALQRGAQGGQKVWLGGADPRSEGIVDGD